MNQLQKLFEYVLDSWILRNWAVGCAHESLILFGYRLALKHSHTFTK